MTRSWLITELILGALFLMGGFCVGAVWQNRQFVDSCAKGVFVSGDVVIDCRPRTGLKLKGVRA